MFRLETGCARNDRNPMSLIALLVAIFAALLSGLTPSARVEPSTDSRCLEDRSVSQQQVDASHGSSSKRRYMLM